MTGNPKFSVKCAWVVLGLGVAGFGAVALAVADGSTTALDRAALLALREADDVSDALGPAWFEEAAAELTALGGYPVLVLAAGLCLVGLLLMKKYRAALLMFLALAGGSAVSTGLKLLFSRPRPDVVEHLDRTFTSSFPSAHAMVSMIGWLTLAAVAIRFIDDVRLRRFVLSSAVGLALFIGITRVYLGVHWPSDVLGGWFIGLAWAAGCWLIAHYVSRSPASRDELGKTN